MSAAYNRLWADLLVEELVRQGVGFFALAPGSRSTPLTLAVARNPRAAHAMHFDERGVAFLALGHARATGRPAAFVCTSGTAVANAMPAVVEAGQDGVPLLLLTADRPPELRHTGANQTIDQVDFFGKHVRWAFDFPPPTADVDPAFVLTTAAAAVRWATHAPAGPVHLNLPFREPLTDDGPAAEIPAHVAAWGASDRPYSFRVPTWEGSHDEPLSEALSGVGRGLLIAGRLPGRHRDHAAVLTAEYLGWPLLTDALSGCRTGDPTDNAVSFSDLALLSERFTDAHAPEAVVLMGDVPLSKRLWTWLGRARPRVFVVIHETPGRLDPPHAVTHHVSTAPGGPFFAVEKDFDRTPDEAWLADWRAASDAAGRVIAEAFDDPAELSEPFVARTVAHGVPDGEALVVAASMPIRDLDQYADPTGSNVPIYANRGASGIDGTVATAAGVARGRNTGAVLLIGDLALLHDLNSLALLRSGPRVVVVVVNNDGGGIFSFLPVAAHTDPATFEPYFGTPHGLTFEPAARMFGLDYAAPTTPTAFRDAYRDALARPTSSIIEVRTDRAEQHALRLAVQARVKAAVDALVP